MSTSPAPTAIGSSLASSRSSESLPTFSNCEFTSLFVDPALGRLASGFWSPLSVSVTTVFAESLPEPKNTDGELNCSPLGTEIKATRFGGLINEGAGLLQASCLSFSSCVIFFVNWVISGIRFFSLSILSGLSATPTSLLRVGWRTYSHLLGSARSRQLYFSRTSSRTYQQERVCIGPSSGHAIQLAISLIFCDRLNLDICLSPVLFFSQNAMNSFTRNIRPFILPWTSRIRFGIASSGTRFFFAPTDGVTGLPHSAKPLGRTFSDIVVAVKTIGTSVSHARWASRICCTWGDAKKN